MDALSELASINNQSSARLREVLEGLGVNSGSSDGAAPGNARGSAYFTAFQPEDTCLRLPPLSVRFFHDAIRFNFLNNKEAQEISYKMALCCRMLKERYNGSFTEVLNGGIFKEFLSNHLSLNEFLHKESVHGWCVDAFAAAFPWPIIPDIHLAPGGYSPAVLSRRKILKISPGPFLRFMSALDMAVLGAWTGFTVSDISQGLSWLQEPTDPEKLEDIVLKPGGSAERIVLPFFSYGFQGVISGVFNGLSSEQKDSVLKILTLFGQSLADSYAYLRRNQCLQILLRNRDAKSIANALLLVVSPVEHLVVGINGRFHAYSLDMEDGYWAGYREHNGQEAAYLSRDLEFDNKSFRHEHSFMGDRFQVVLKPLQDNAGLDPIFTWISLQTRLAEILHIPSLAPGNEPLALSMLVSLKETLESRTARTAQAGGDKSRGDFGRQKRLCIVELLIDNFDRGEVEITNHMLKSRLERKLGPRAPIKLNGYQIAGRALERVKNEFGEDFRRCVKFEPVGPNKVRLSWTPG